MSDPAPRPIVPLLLHALQALTYGALSWELGERWSGYAAALGAAAALQIAGGVARLAGRPRITGTAAVLCLLVVLGLYGEVISQALYMERAFGPQTAEAAIQSLGVPALLIPWLLAIPLTQLGQLRRAHLLLLVAPLHGLSAWGDPFAGPTGGHAPARARRSRRTARRSRRTARARRSRRTARVRPPGRLPSRRDDPDQGRSGGADADR